MSENSEPQTDSAPADEAQSTQPPQASSGTSPADSDHSGDSAAPDSASIGGISDDQLPEDLQPGEDNPLAEPLDPDDEATKSQEELEMDATQEDLGNDDGASQAPDQEGDDVTGGGAGQSTEDGSSDDSSDDG
jgi:hypothetical protein